MRVVLALKDTDLRLSIELLLSEQPGIRILGSAIDTQGMLALVESSNPDLLLMESDLPGEAIVDVLSEMKSHKACPKIILLGKPGDRERHFLDSGADVYLLKGERPEKLVDAFHNLA